MREINNKFPTRTVGLGGSCACNGQGAQQARHDNKCRSQPIPLHLDIAAPTVAGGVVTQAALDEMVPDHDGDRFDPETMFLTAEYVNEDGNLTDSSECYVRFIKIGKKSFDCLGQDETRGVQVLAFSQPNCCDGRELCVPAFGNKKSDKDSLTIEIVNHQTETLADGTVVGRPVRLRGFIRGSCESCGYEAMCPVPGTAA